MPLPKRRHSHQRQAKRRTHYKLHHTGVGECPRCHAAKPQHFICNECGFYNGRTWMTPKNTEATATA